MAVKPEVAESGNLFGGHPVASALGAAVVGLLVPMLWPVGIVLIAVAAFSPQLRWMGLPGIFLLVAAFVHLALELPPKLVS